MKNNKNITYYSLVLGVACIPFMFMFFAPQKKQTPEHKKKVLIFSSTGGGGHISATKALEHYLSPYYDVSSEYLLENVLKSIDPVQVCTFGKFSGEKLYNILLYHQHFGILNILHSIGPWILNLNADQAQKCLLAYLRKEKPDLVISVMPIFNHMLLRATRKLSIPLLVSATDMDINTFLENLEVAPCDQFYLNLTYSDKKMRQLALEKGVEPDKLFAYGMPLRPSFFENYETKEVRHQFNIPQDKFVILVMLGAQGSKQTHLIARQLKKIKHPVHVVFCTGKNDSLKSQIHNIQYPEHVSITVVGFTNKIAALMSCSDLLISKGGGATTFEALHAKLPLLLDGTSTTLKWERYVHHFVYQNQCGQTIKTIRSISPIINDLLECPKKLEGYRYGLSFIKTQNAGEKIKELVDSILC